MKRLPAGAAAVAVGDAGAPAAAPEAAMVAVAEVTEVAITAPVSGGRTIGASCSGCVLTSARKVSSAPPTGLSITWRRPL